MFWLLTREPGKGMAKLGNFNYGMSLAETQVVLGSAPKSSFPTDDGKSMSVWVFSDCTVYVTFDTQGKLDRIQYEKPEEKRPLLEQIRSWLGQ
jgi:hypothetical protein